METPNRLFALEVPAALIAQRPLPERDQSRMMLLRRRGEGAAHHRFAELPALLPADALLVLNNTRVIPARLEGRRPGGGAVEALLTEELAPGRWRAMVKNARRLHPGDRLEFAAGAIPAEAREREREGTWVLEFAEAQTLRERLREHGQTPLPPYVKRNGDSNGGATNGSASKDGASNSMAARHREWYQTVYGRVEGSIAAPTAGFHFTPAVFEALAARGIARTELTLHVGAGTFLPIQGGDVEHHRMHREWFTMEPAACRAILGARAAGRPVVAVGTTTVRALESWARQGFAEGCAGFTELFIRPPYEFRAVDGLLTNFHQPASTLLQLVAAFHGEAAILAAYREAIARGYRFYSYGDCMAILPQATG